jgi:hypothetical protein
MELTIRSRAFWYFQPSHYGFFAVVTRFATSQFEREFSDCIPPASNFLLSNQQCFVFTILNEISSRQFVFEISNEICNIILSEVFFFWILISFLEPTIRSKAFWYFQPSHYVFFAVVTRFATSQFEREFSDCIPPASNFLFLVAVLKKIMTWIRTSIPIQ